MNLFWCNFFLFVFFILAEASVFVVIRRKIHIVVENVNVRVTSGVMPTISVVTFFFVLLCSIQLASEDSAKGKRATETKIKREREVKKEKVASGGELQGQSGRKSIVKIFRLLKNIGLYFAVFGCKPIMVYFMRAGANIILTWTRLDHTIIQPVADLEHNRIK